MLICILEINFSSHVVRGLRIKGVQGFRKVAGRGWCRELYIFFKASKRVRNSINEIPPPSKLRA